VSHVAQPDAMSPELKTKRSRSFGQAASHYMRYRPGPPLEAVTWLLPDRVGTVVDLGAGTGALTRILSDRADRVIAVEPDEQMRSVLLDEVPGATVVEGQAESMPLPDSSAEAVLASSSWHWVDPGPALAEVGRVLVPGGLLGAMWSGPDADSAFMSRARELFAGVEAHDAPTSAAVETLHSMSAQAQTANNVLEIPEGAPFAEPDYERFCWDMTLTGEELVGLMGTMSWVIIMEPPEREALLGLVRRLLRDALGVDADSTLEVPFRCDTYRSRLTS
jgi:SAM-dependent methyltransferase